MATGVLVQRLPQAGRLSDWLEIVRPFSLPASLVPVAVGAGVAWWHQRGDLSTFLLMVLGVLMLQAGTNVINEVYDHAAGADTAQTPRASRVITEGRLDPLVAARGGIALLAGGAAVGALLSWGVGLGPVPFELGAAGALLGYAYTAPPLRFKYRGFGVPAVILVMGPLMVVGAAFSQTGLLTADAALASVPVGLLVGAIILANDLRDVATDAAAGARTFAVRAGFPVARASFVAMVVGAYAAVPAEVAAGFLPPASLLCLFALPLGARLLRHARTEAGSGLLARLDQESALNHMVFGMLLALGLVWAGLHHV